MGDDADRHILDLPRFFIGRFEVTVGQFRTFVEDDGYVLEDARSMRGASDHPVRRISWHAAMAYGVWLTRTLHTWSGTPRPLADRLRGSHERSPWRVTLPSEAEWEKAARGAHGRIYPWGDAPPARDLANYPDAGLRTTAPVGSFPRGASPYGVLDMSGNVWDGRGACIAITRTMPATDGNRRTVHACECCAADRFSTDHTTCRLRVGWETCPTFG